MIPLNPDQKQEKSKHIPMIMQNRMPGYETMDKEEYFQKELEVLPEACDVRVCHCKRIFSIRVIHISEYESKTLGKPFCEDWDGTERRTWILQFT